MADRKASDKKRGQPKSTRRTSSSRARLERLKKRFLEQIALCPSISLACEVSGLPRATYYEQRDQDTEFAAQVDAARDRGVDAFEDRCLSDAHHGIERPIYQQGKLVGYERIYSDKMRELMLKSHRPERYREGNALAASAGDLLALLVNLSRPREIGAPDVQVIDHKPQGTE